MRRVACDPGKTGAFAWEAEDGTVVCANMPETEGDIVKIVEDLPRCELTAFMEQIPEAVRVKGRVIVSPKLHANAGFIRGMLMALDIPVVLTRPQDWQKAFHIGKSKDRTEHKNKLKAEAQRRFPHLKVTLANADALLILEAARMGAIQ